MEKRMMRTGLALFVSPPLFIVQVGGCSRFFGNLLTNAIKNIKLNDTGVASEDDNVVL